MKRANLFSFVEGNLGKKSHLFPFFSITSPCYVDKDSDLEVAAKRIAYGKFTNAGQVQSNFRLPVDEDKRNACTRSRLEECMGRYAFSGFHEFTKCR